MIHLEAVKIYNSIRRTRVDFKPDKKRRNAVPVRGKPVIACDSEPYLYFKSQTAAKLALFGERGSKLHTGISRALREKVATVLGWRFIYA